MNAFLTPIFERIQNVLTIVPKELEALTNENIVYIAINGGVVFIFFYFISRWFKSYFARLGFFLFGAWVLWELSAKSYILQHFDLYGGLGLLLPHLEIPSLTLLIIKYRINNI